jgi:hypothetical protein
MKFDRKMTDRQQGATPRRAWARPALVRLEAGAAESGTRTVVTDGPLGSYS